MTGTWLRINGLDATEIAAHTPPTWETLADGGIGEVTFALAVSPRTQHQALRPKALVEVMCGPMPLATAQMTEFDRTTGQAHAFGLSAPLRRIIALDAGATTRNLTPAIAAAVAAGWPGTNPTPIAGTAAGDATGNPVKVADLLDDYAAQTGQRWGVDGQGRIYMRPDPITPTWLAYPDASAFGVTNEDSPTMLAGRYFDGALFATAYAGSGEPQDVVDLTDRGTLSLAAAEAILEGMLVRRGVRQWTNGTTLHRDQLTTIGGVPAFLPSVVAGRDMFRAHGLTYDGPAGQLALDEVVGKTRYTAGDDVIYLEPVNKAPRTQREVMAAA